MLWGLISIDIVATEPPAGAAAPEAGRRSFAVEFDGPQHFSRVFAAPNAGGEAAFARGPPPTAAMALRDRLIRLNGGFAGLVVVPFFEWVACANRPERDAYMAGLLLRA